MGTRPSEPQRNSQVPDMERAINTPSWAAFVFNWLYLAYMRAYRHFALALIAWILSAAVATASQSDFWQVVVAGIAFLQWLYYGFVGKSIAWRSRTWRDFEDFLSCQRTWDEWAKLVVLVITTLTALNWCFQTLGTSFQETSSQSPAVVLERPTPAAAALTAPESPIPPGAVIVLSHDAARRIRESVELGLSFASITVILKNTSGSDLTGTVVYEGRNRKGVVVAFGEAPMFCVRGHSLESEEISVQITGMPMRHTLRVRDLRRCPR